MQAKSHTQYESFFYRLYIYICVCLVVWSTWTSRCARARQWDSLIGHSLRGCLGASLSFYLCHNRLRGDWRFWFSYWTSIAWSWSSLVHTVPAGRGADLGLVLGLWLFCHSRIRPWATFHGGCAVLVGDWLRSVGLPGVHRLSVSGSQLCVSLWFLVATLWSPFDCGRLLKGEVGAVGVGLRNAGSSFQDCCRFSHFLLGVTGVCLGSLAVTLQTDTKYTLTQSSYIHDKRSLLHKQSKQ